MTACVGQKKRSIAAALLISSVLIVGCQARPGSVSFQGNPRRAIVDPEQMVELPALPRGAVRLGRVSAHCQQLEQWEAFEARPLLDVDCTEVRLRRMLREAGARNGGDLLAAVECAGHRSRSCSAIVGRGAVLRSERRPPTGRGDVRGAVAREVRVDFSPAVSGLRAEARDEESVRDAPLLPPSHRVIGSFSTFCDVCSELETRDALRLAAASLGASDIVGVRCVPWESGFRCAGAAARPLVAE